jgi:hypothetical protein
MISWKRKVEKEKGLLCGCDAQQEWLLPWWWERYSKHNAFPVTFIDFGMSEQARTFCRLRGELITLDVDDCFIQRKEQLSKERVASWETIYGPTLWSARLRWFKKPFALLHSTYRFSLWLDLDCEILGPLDSLFTACTEESQLALVREYTTEHLSLLDPGVVYNGGVIAFLHGAFIISQWAAAALHESGSYWSDDALLSSLICQNALSVVELPDIYNWRFAQGVNINAIIHHWVGSAGKAYIRHYGGLASTLSKFFKDAH